MQQLEIKIMVLSKCGCDISLYVKCKKNISVQYLDIYVDNVMSVSHINMNDLEIKDIGSCPSMISMCPEITFSMLPYHNLKHISHRQR